MRLVLALVAVNAFAAAVSLIGFPARTDAGFFWELTPPISAALFGSLYLVSGGLVTWAAVQGWWEPARGLVPMVLVFSGLMLTTTALHLDRFDGGGRLAYWLVVYAVALVAAVGFFVQHERAGARWAVDALPVAAVRVVTLLTGVLLVGLVAVGYVAPALLAAHWPWPLTPLTTRAFLSWVGALGVGLVWTAIDTDRRRARPVAWLLVAAALVLTFMLVGYRHELSPGASGRWILGGGLAGLGLLGAVLLLAPDGRPRPGGARWLSR
jgi:hypothetical protein